ncbi:AAA domain-containing protein [Streptomyces niveus]|uniref:AAA domain-containing protein n=1 Tax=Streptomyces niveus TaxID=193462 RepID=UPI00368045D2
MVTSEPAYRRISHELHNLSASSCRWGRCVGLRHSCFCRGQLWTDQLDSLRLAGPERDGIETDGFAVSDLVQDGSLLTLHVAEFADVADPHLWMLKQPPTFLVEALRDGISGLGEHPLAAALAAGRIGGVPAHEPDPPGYHPAQADAYRACLGEGVHLVRGPPGTGKTTVLSRAIGDLITRGDRVLLVSAMNVAVDNALLGVVRVKRHQPGDIVRVGPPHLREVAEDASVSLPLMVKARLADTADRLRAVEAELVAIKHRALQLASMEGGLAGFDSAAYFAALKLLRTPGGDLASAQSREEAARRSLALARAAFQDATAAARTAVALDRAAESSRQRWLQADRLSEEVDQTRGAVEHREAAALLAQGTRDSLRQELAGIGGMGAVKRWRLRERHGELETLLTDADEVAADAARSATEARATAGTHIAALDKQITALIAGIALGRKQAAHLAADVTVRQADEQRAEQRSHLCETEKTRAEEAVERAKLARDLTQRCEQRGWPAQFDQAHRLRTVVTADPARKSALEKEHQRVQEEYERLARDAQSEIIKGAKLVATTLARFRTNPAVFEGPYDVVLVDEAGAATLPEVLLATGKADRAAVLLGDFMQLGAVIPGELKDHDRADITRWLLPDVFQHCGITEPLEARAHLTGSRSGWWPAGSLIARALAELHSELGEKTGIVTPYRATLEALRDVEGPGGGALAEVGTAHKFQGREFDVVVFDTVEGGAGARDLWMAKAHFRPAASSWPRDGVRLFNVAVTRVKTRLYVIASGERVKSAEPGTALAQLAALIGTQPGVRVVHAKTLITPPTAPFTFRGEFGTALADVLSRHVEVTEIDDERDFYRTFTEEIRHAQRSLWLWAPWVARRVGSLLPALRAAADRGVRINVFIRDDTDQLQKKPPNQKLIADLRAVAHAVVPMNVMHQKIAVIDERTVMLGSLNVLSQSWTREVMLTMRGAHFARKLLAHEHAAVFAAPPRCGRCGGDEIEIRLWKSGWVWRCYAFACKTTPKGGTNAWTQHIPVGR